MKKILISGGTGLIGKQLCCLLESKGFSIALLSRSKSNSAQKIIKWDIEKNFIEEDAIEYCDHIIHLAGAGIADEKWTPDRKKEIIDSRVKSTELLVNFLEKNNKKALNIVAASAIGIYGTETTKKLYTEKDSNPGVYIADVVQEWEKATNMLAPYTESLFRIRIGVVLANNGGVLVEMTKPPFLSPLGHGKQHVPWIHINDVCNAILWMLQHPQKQGIYNAVAPEFATNKEFTKALSKHSGKLYMPIHAPAFVVKLLAGEMASLVLEGSKISPQKILDAGFQFQFPQLDKALEDIYSKK